MSKVNKVEVNTEALDAIKMASESTASAKKDYESAFRFLKTVKQGDKDYDKAKSDLEKKKESYLAKKAIEVKARIKAAQKGDYLPEEKERNLFHANLEVPAFDKNDGRKISQPFLQKFNARAWNNFLQHSKSLGYAVELIWNPELYNA